MNRVRRSAAIYFLIQGLAVFAWWIMLYLWPEARQWFVLDAGYETSLLAFRLADISFLGFGSIVAAWLIYSASEIDKIAAWTVTGCASYAAIYSFNYTLMTDRGWLGVVLMLPAMIWCGVFSVGLTFERSMFRHSADGSAGWMVTKTSLQIVIVWSVILGVIPYLITVVEDKIGIGRLSFPYQKPVAAILFVLISSVGVYAAYVMSTVGKGTPLPLDHATRLVVAGPYKYVRNPMAVSGIGQGLAIALLLGSPLTALYALMGSLIWQLIFRPLEEDDLERRFGDDFVRYREAVPCWLPRITPYQMDGTAASSNSASSPLGRI